MRGRFMFAVEERIREDQKKMYDERKEKDQIMGPPPQKQVDCLCFVKHALPDSKDISFLYSFVVDRLD